MVYGRIYKAEFPNGKLYVGLTTMSLKRRVWAHMSAAKKGKRDCPALRNAIRKYGKPKFTEICSASSKEDLDSLEKYWIAELGTLVPSGYNIKEGGNSGRHSEETKNKMRSTRRADLSLVGCKLTPEEASRAQALYASGEHTQNELAVMFGVGRGSLKNALYRGQNYKVRTKLTANDVIKIKELISEGYTGKHVATLYRISASTVSNVLNSTLPCYRGA